MNKVFSFLYFFYDSCLLRWKVETIGTSKEDATHYYDADDLASPDTADKTYRKALGKTKKELKKKDIS